MPLSGVLIDSSVVLDVLTRDPVHFNWSREQIVRAGSHHELWINAMVYAEISVGFSRIEDLDEAMNGMGLVMKDLPRAALFLAGKAFLAYRRRGGTRSSPLPDFFIGAHAAAAGVSLLTRDPSRVRAAYPTVHIISPEKAK